MAASELTMKIGLDPSEAKRELNKFLNSTSGFSDKVAKNLVANVGIAFPDFNSVAESLKKNLASAARKIKSTQSNYFQFGDGTTFDMDFSKFSRKNMSKDFISDLDRNLSRVLSEKRAGTLTSAVDIDIQKITELRNVLRQAKNDITTLTRVSNKQLTVDTNAKNTKRDPQEVYKRDWERLRKQIAQAYITNKKRGGDDPAMLKRLANLYDQVARSAQKAGDNEYYKKARQRSRDFLRQYNEILKINNGYEHQGRLLGGLKNLMSRYFSIYTISSFLQKVAEMTGYFQQQQVALEGILGSAAKAQSVLNDIRSFSLKSPFQTKELVSFTKQLSAFGVGGDDLFPTVKRLADISAGLGVDMSRIILAYGQVKSASVLRGQELRQFTEAGVPLVKDLADKFSELNGKLVTTGDIFKMISERKVSFEMVSEVLSDMTAEGGKFYKMQESITDTLYGQIQKLKDMWTLALESFGKATGGWLMKIVKGFQGLIQKIPSIASGLTAAFMVDRLITYADQLRRIISLTLRAKATMSMWSGVAGAAIGAISYVITNLVMKARELGRRMNEAATSVQKDTNRMVRGLSELSNKINAANVGTKKYADAVSALSSNYGEFLSDDFIKKLSKTDDTARQLADSFKSVALSIKEVIKEQGLYKSAVAKGDAAADAAGIRTRANLSKKGVRSRFGVSESTNQMNESLSRYINNGGYQLGSFIDLITDIAATTISEEAKNGTNLKDIDDALKTAIKSMFSDLSTSAAEDIVKWINYGGIDAESYQKALDQYNAANGYTYAKIKRPFDVAQRIISNGEKTGFEEYGVLGNDMRMRQALREAMENGNFATYEGSKLEAMLKDGNKYDYGTASEILEEVRNFRKSIDENDHASLGRLDQIEKYFSEGVGVRKNGDHAEIITNAFNPIQTIATDVAEESEEMIDIVQYLVDALGITREQAAGILGNLYHESAGLNPAAYNKLEKAGIHPNSKANGAGYGAGIVQWSLDRKPRILDYINKKYNKNYTSIEESLLEEQLDALVYEMQSFYGNVITALKKTTTSDEAADVIADKFEGIHDGTLPTRKQYAKDILEGKKLNNKKISERLLSFGYSSWFSDERLRPYALQFGSPTDQNIREKRSNLEQTISDLEKEYKKQTDEGDYSQEHKDLKYVIDELTRLYTDPHMYGGVLGESERNWANDLNEFIGTLKEAYEVYKKATNAEGIDLGLGYMKNNPKMIERFANLFNDGIRKNGFDIFKNEYGQDIKVGENGQLLRDVLRDTFINSGLEKGVINFEKAIRALAKALHDYGVSLGKGGRQFTSQAKELNKYADTIAKDNLDAWVRDINNEFKSLTRTFELADKQIELYRKLQQKGNSSRELYRRINEDGLIWNQRMSDSTIQEQNIVQMMTKYNDIVKRETGGKGSALSFRYGTISDVATQIEEIKKYVKLNDKNFSAEAFGEAGKEIIAMLEKYLTTLIREIGDIDLTQNSGNKMSDLITNSQSSISGARYNATRKLIDARKHNPNGDNGAAAAMLSKELESSMMSIFDQFVNDNKFEVLSNVGRGDKFGGKAIDIEALRKKYDTMLDSVTDETLKALLEEKWRDFERSAEDFNIKAGSITGMTNGIRQYKNADSVAKERWQKKENQRISLESDLEEAKAIGDTTQIVELEAKLQLCNKELAEMGNNGEKLADQLKQAALANIQGNLEAASKSLDAIAGASKNMIASFRSLVTVVSTFYDAVADGENPKELEDMGAFLDDFGEAFEQMIAPMTAVIALLTSMIVIVQTLNLELAPMMAAMLSVVLIAAAVAGVVAAFKQYDRSLEHDIDNLKDKIDELDYKITCLERTMKNMDSEAGRSVGLEKLRKTVQSFGTNAEIAAKEMEKAAKMQEIINKENEKKNTDEDKIKDYQRQYDEFVQNALDANNALLDSILSTRDEMLGSVENWSSAMSSAIRNAFQNGENASRAFRDTVKTMIGDIVEQMVKMTILEPLLSAAFEQFLGGSIDEIKEQFFGNGKNDYQGFADFLAKKALDKKAIKELNNNVNKAGESAIDFVDSLGTLKDYYMHSPSHSGLSSGLESITEDTARTLEAIQSTMLNELFLISNTLGDSDILTKVQISWFNDMLMHTAAIRENTDRLTRALSPDGLSMKVAIQ